MTGFVKYNVDYTALMFRPFKNEVLDAVVKSVSEVCDSRADGVHLVTHSFLRARLSALPRHEAGRNAERYPLNSPFVGVQIGFFAEAGPLSIAVSNAVSLGTDCNLRVQANTNDNTMTGMDFVWFQR